MTAPDRDQIALVLGRAWLDAIAFAMARVEAPVVVMPATGDERLMTLDQVAEVLAVGQTTVKELTAAGGPLEVVHLGRAVRVPASSVQAYIAALRSEQLLQGEAPTPIGRRRRAQS